MFCFVFKSMTQEDGYRASGPGKNVIWEIFNHLFGDLWYSSQVRSTVISLSVRISYSLFFIISLIYLQRQRQLSLQKKWEKKLYFSAGNRFEMQRPEEVTRRLLEQGARRQEREVNVGINTCARSLIRHVKYGGCRLSVWHFMLPKDIFKNL